MIRLRYKILGIVGILLSVFLWGRCGRNRDTVHKTPVALPPNETERITVDPSGHRLTITTPVGTRTLALPDRASTIDVSKDGSARVTAQQLGFERRLFGGIHASDKFRVAAGVDMWYFKRLDLGVGLAGELGPHLPIAFAQVSYNVWSNCRIGLAYGSNRFIGGTLTVRL